MNTGNRNYEEDIELLLDALYWDECNIRLENGENGYVFSHVKGWPRGWFSDNITIVDENVDGMLARVLAPEIDWYIRCTGPTLQSVCVQLKDILMKDQGTPYTKAWLSGAEEYIYTWEDKDGSDKTNHAPIKQKLDSKSKAFAETLRQLHANRIFFKIESNLDLGYKISLIDKTIQPSRVEIDDYNCRLHPGLNLDNADNFRDLQPMPEKDTIITFHADWHVSDTLDELDAFLKTHQNNIKI